MGTSTSRVSPLTVSRGSPVLATSPTGATLRKASSSLDNALTSLEAELRPRSRPAPEIEVPSYMRDRSRRLSSSPTEQQLPLSPQPAAPAKQHSAQHLRRSPSLSPPRDRGGDGGDRGGDWGEISLRGDRGPPSLEVRAARAAAAAAKLMTGGKGGNGSAAEREAEAEGELAASEEPSLYDLGLRPSMLPRKRPGSLQPMPPPTAPEPQKPARLAQGRPPEEERRAALALLVPAQGRRCPRPL